MKEENGSQVDRFVCKARAILKSYRDLRGLVIYSNKRTLRPGAVLFYGFNPGYNPREEHRIFWSIEKSLDQFANDFEELENGKDTEGETVSGGERLHPNRNLIDDQRWPFQNLEDDFPAGRAPYQEHTRNLLRAVGQEDTLITNLLFLQAARPKHIREELEANDRDFEDFKAACWKVHDLIFGITTPSVLITCASVLQNGLHKRLSLTLVPPTKNSGYGPRQRKWHCKQWVGTWQDQSGCKNPITVCQIPHMSYYDISHKPEVVEWAKGVVESAKRS